MNRSRIPILISLVSHNSSSDIERCLAAVRAQTVPVRVKLLDNASSDDTLKRVRPRDIEVSGLMENIGYCRAHNWNLLSDHFQYALLLNPDVILEPDHLEKLVEALETVEGAGMAGGKLCRMDASGEPVIREGYPQLDSTGIYMTPDQRHLDRGAGRPDRGQFERRQKVFGITGAALLCRREMVDDLRMGGEFLDEDFFSFREDADLAWRARLRGWEAVYEPSARALHRRQVTPERRRELSPAINYHSLKNRYLMRRKCIDAAVRRKCFPYMWLRDLGILAYVIASERTSLGAYQAVWRLRHRFLWKRQQVQSTRRAGPEALARWFSFEPQAIDV